MGVSKYTPSRLVYILAREDIRLSHLVPETPAVKEVLQARRRKEEDVWSEFYTTDAVLYRDWAQGNYELRHIVWASKAVTEAHVTIESEEKPRYFIICNSEYVYH